MTSEGREKMGSYIQVQEQYRTTGFFFFFLFRVKKKRFPGDRHFDNRKSQAIECAALDLYKKKEKGNPGPIFL